MSFNPSEAAKGGGNFEKEFIPEGVHPAVCTRIIEVGQQESPYGVNDDVIFSFSIPSVKVNYKGEEKQAMISSFGIAKKFGEKANMTKYTEALNPSAQSLGDMLERPCAVHIEHYEKKSGKGTGERIKAVMPLMAGVDVPAPDTTPFWFDWENPTMEVWDLIPEWIQNRIMGATNYEGSPIHKLLLEDEASL